MLLCISSCCSVSHHAALYLTMPSGAVHAVFLQGYAGALQCLLEEEGEVAWVKHTTALERPKSQRVGTSDDRLRCVHLHGL